MTKHLGMTRRHYLAAAGAVGGRGLRQGDSVPPRIQPVVSNHERGTLVTNDVADPAPRRDYAEERTPVVPDPRAVERMEIQ